MLPHTIQAWCVLALATTWASAQSPMQGKTVGVIDGDTIEVTRTVNGRVRVLRVRIYGIDAPEKRQPYGEKAKLLLSKLVFGKVVSIYPKDTDRYGRVVAAIYSDRRSVGISLVESGHAWWYPKYAPGDFALRDAQARARKQRRGLWSEKNPVAPWEFRKKK